MHVPDRSQIRRHPNGSLDTEYYIHKCHVDRSLAAHAGLTGIARSIKSNTQQLRYLLYSLDKFFDKQNNNLQRFGILTYRSRKLRDQYLRFSGRRQKLPQA